MSALPDKANSTKLDLRDNPSKPRRGSWTFLKRGIALSVSAALVAVVITTVLPPLVADQSDRAVVNAPVTLLTAPIDGEIHMLAAEPGSAVEQQSPVAEVINNRVDRATLIALEAKKADSGQKLTAIRSRLESDGQYILMLGAEIDRQKAALIGRYQQQIVDLKAQVGSASATMQEKQQVLSNQSDMVRRDVVSPMMTQAATQQLSAAGYQKQSADSKLAEKQAQLETALHDIYVGDDVHDLAALIQKKRDMELDVQRLGIERVQTAAALDDDTRLYGAERKRLAMLERSTIAAPVSGEILNASAAVGRHVNAGDTLARMLDCNDAFVVAIFSYRRGADLSVGTRVTIDAGSAGTQQGTVTAVLPKTSDKVDETYAVPFPQTERRELYVLVHPDSPLRTVAPGTGRSQCDVGQWVTVARADGWVPSTSVMWREAGRLVSAAASSLIPRSWAKGEQTVRRRTAALPSPNWGVVPAPLEGGVGDR